MAHYPSGSIRPKKPQQANDWPADKRWVVGYIRVSDNPQAEPDRASLGEQNRVYGSAVKTRGISSFASSPMWVDAGMPPARTSRKWSVLSEKIFEPVI